MEHSVITSESDKPAFQLLKTELGAQKYYFFFSFQFEPLKKMVLYIKAVIPKPSLYDLM